MEAYDSGCGAQTIGEKRTSWFARRQENRELRVLLRSQSDEREACRIWKKAGGLYDELPPLSFSTFT